MVLKRIYFTPKRVGSYGGLGALMHVVRVTAKRYMSNWSEKIFTIREVPASDPPVYRLVNDLGEVMDGIFYEHQPQKVSVSKDKLYRVQKVLQRRMVGKKTRLLMSWSGYPSSFNSWIDASALFKYKG